MNSNYFFRLCFRNFSQYKPINIASINSVFKKGVKLIEVQGWVQNISYFKNHAFIKINDGSTFHSLQIVLPKQAFTSINVTGQLVPSISSHIQSFEIHASSFNLIGSVQQPYPLEKKYHSVEYLRSILHLRPRTLYTNSILRIRNSAMIDIHNFLQSKGFFNIHLPVLSPLDSEGAGDLFKVESNNKNNFFPNPMYLSVSSQLYCEMLSSSFRSIYSFGPVFRADHSHTSHHLCEFYMVEPEMAFADMNMAMKLSEELCQNVFQTIFNKHMDEIEYFQKMNPQYSFLDHFNSFLENPFDIIEYSTAIKVLSEIFPIKYGENISREQEIYLSNQYCRRPVFIINHPKTLKPFYMLTNNDNNTVASFDLIFPYIGEMVGGSQRIHNYEILKESILEHHIDIQTMKSYLDLRRYGSVPHSGFGLGFDRFIQYIAGAKNIKDVIAFPRSHGVSILT